jgi:hypothetical protein
MAETGIKPGQVQLWGFNDKATKVAITFCSNNNPELYGPGLGYLYDEFGCQFDNGPGQDF